MTVRERKQLATKGIEETDSFKIPDVLIQSIRKALQQTLKEY